MHQDFPTYYISRTPWTIIVRVSCGRATVLKSNLPSYRVGTTFIFTYNYLWRELTYAERIKYGQI